MYICLNCGYKGPNILGIWREDKLICRNCRNCPNTTEEVQSELIEVDDCVADIIITLNRNGYKTLHSCEGHMYNNKTVTVDEGYISIEDMNTDLSDELSFLPDAIGKYKILYELAFGPRNILDRTFVNKFVLRFVRDDCDKISFWDFQKDKVQFFEELEIIIDQNRKTYGKSKGL